MWGGCGEPCHAQPIRTSHSPRDVWYRDQRNTIQNFYPRASCRIWFTSCFAAACFYRHLTVLHATCTVSTYSSHFLFRFLSFISALRRSRPLYPITLPYTHSPILSCSHSGVYLPLVPASYIQQACPPIVFFTCRGNDIYPCSTLTSSCLLAMVAFSKQSRLNIGNELWLYLIFSVSTHRLNVIAAEGRVIASTDMDLKYYHDGLK